MNDTKNSFNELYEVIKRLRAPDGCPWDREQTPETMTGDLLEEVYEAIDAIKENDDSHLMEELGDVFLVVTMISYMKEQEGSFSINSVLKGISEKLIRRHPHVFGDSDAEDSDEVLKQWQQIKVDVEGRKPKTSLLDKVSKGLPPLERSYKLQKKAAKAGFDWPDIQGVWDKVHEEIDEVRDVSPENRDHLKEEIGDLLFSVVNISRYLGIDPADALHKCNAKFSSRFSYVEKKMKQNGLEMSEKTFNEMDQFWEESKSR